MIVAVEQRKSVRTYQNEPLSMQDQLSIKKLLKHHEALKGPFGNSINLFYYNNDTRDEDDSKKIGTYGFIKHPPAFFGGTCENHFKALVDFGYVFEMLILRLTKKGLGTVWLGGTFKREDFKAETKEGEVIPAISPVGFANDKRSLREKLIRSGAKADQRKPFSELFYDGTIQTPIEDAKKEKHPMYKYLELVRLGPSASNKQPWRVIVKQNKLHLYLKRTPNYGEKLPYDIQALDIGIAAAHIEVGLEFDNLRFKRFEDEEHYDYPDMTYVLTYEIITR